MNIEYEKDVMVITHPSGLITRYNKADLEEHKADLQSEQLEINKSIMSVQMNIASIEQEN